jgi:predicted ATPase
MSLPKPPPISSSAAAVRSLAGPRPGGFVTKFGVKNFRSIHTVSVHLQQLSVFIGANGAGKTNLIQAMQMFGELMNAGSTEPIIEQGWETIAYRRTRTSSMAEFAVRISIPYAFQELDGTVVRVSRLTVDLSLRVAHRRVEDDVVVKREAFRISRRVGNVNHSLSVTVDAAGRIRAESGTDRELWRLATSGYGTRLPRGEVMTADGVRAALEGATDSALPSAVDRTVLVIPRLLTGTDWFERTALPLCRVQRLRVESSGLRGNTLPISAAVRGELGSAGEGLPDAVARLKRENRFAPVLAAMQEVLPRLEDVVPVRIQPGRKGLSFREREMVGALPEFAVSDGTIHTLALLVALETPPRVAIRRPLILALEEPENAIHPWALATILRRARNRATAGRRQVLITTHSPIVVDSVPPKSLFVVEHDGSTTTVIPATRVRDDLEERLARTGMSLGEVWYHGLLGGTPDHAK